MLNFEALKKFELEFDLLKFNIHFPHFTFTMATHNWNNFDAKSKCCIIRRCM